jgi:hypothetical protein
MTEFEAEASLRRLYVLTAIIGMCGALLCGWWRGFGAVLAFALGAAASMGNVWVFERLARSFAPGDPHARKPWPAGTYIIRYILLLGIGYATVKFLGADPFALILGLLCSAVAVLVSLIFELAQSLFRSRRSS